MYESDKDRQQSMRNQGNRAFRDRLPRLSLVSGQKTCSVRAMMSSWMALSSEVKKAL